MMAIKAGIHKMLVRINYSKDGNHDRAAFPEAVWSRYALFV